MLRSSHVVIGAVVTALVVGGIGFVAFGDGTDDTQEVQADYAEACVNEATGEVVNYDDCKNPEHSHSHLVWFPNTYAAPPVGGRYDKTRVLTVKPATGTVAPAPARGGFGGFKAPAGG